MRIGLITGEYPPMQGGVGAFSRELAAAFVQRRHELYILTDRRAAASAEPGIRVQTVGNWNVASLLDARRWAQANRLDLINIEYEAAAFQMAPLVHWLPGLTSPPAPLSILWRGKARRIPVVTTFHDLLVPYLFPKAGPTRWRALLALARSSDGVIATNRQDEQQLEAAGRIKRLCRIPIGSNIHVVPPPGYDRATWRDRLGISGSAILAGYFGFMNASKGVDTLLNGVSLAVKQGVDARLLMIGGRTGSSDPTNAAYADQIDSLIAQLNLQSRVQWTGFADDSQVSAHLLACDLLALPYNDGVSFRRGSFMAALAHGCAIITTRPAVELPEMQDGVNVRLIPPEAPEALAETIRQLGTDSALRQRLGANAKALSQEFTWDRIAAQTADFYREIIGDGLD
jgi:glycosyltransferase involved in cell wall biosynthesis